MAKGRPFTTEEYERMLMATWKVVTQAESRGDDATKLSEHETAVVESWKELFTGLWLSGLRLGEALILSWAENAKVSVLMGRQVSCDPLPGRGAESPPQRNPTAVPRIC